MIDLARISIMRCSRGFVFLVQQPAHMMTVCCDPVDPPLPGMTQVVSEDALQRGLDKIDEGAGQTWVQGQLDYTTRPLLSESWILDIDTTISPHREALQRKGCSPDLSQ